MKIHKYMNGSSIPTHTKYNNRLDLGNECNRALGMYIKYTIRSIVFEASSHPVTRSLGHLVTRSLSHPVIIFNIVTDELTNEQHQGLQVCFADKKTRLLSTHDFRFHIYGCTIQIFQCLVYVLELQGPPKQ